LNPVVLDGEACEVGLESTILDMSRGEPVLLCPGIASLDDIACGRVERSR